MAISFISAIPSSVKNAGALSGLPVTPISASTGDSLKNTIPRIHSDGVTELGQYLDLHNLSNVSDFDVRLVAEGNGDLRVYNTQYGRATITADLSGTASYATNANYANSAGSAGSADGASYLKDRGNGVATYSNYGAAGLNYGSYTWLAGWNGYELRAIHKSQYARSSGFSLSGSTLSINL